MAQFIDTVPLADDGRVMVPTPVAYLDLRFATADHAATYRWDVKPTETDLGTLRLVRGSSISGFVVDGEDERPEADVQVVVSDAGAQGDEPNRSRRTRARPHAVTNERGFFRLVGVAPGVHRLEAAKEGWAITSFEPVEVDANAETHVDEAIALRRPVTLDVVVTPPLDASGEPWWVTLAPRVSTVDRPALLKQQLDVAGSSRFTELTPQSYTLRIGTADQGTIQEQVIDLQQSRLLDLTLPLVVVTGTVRLNDEPIVGRIRIEAGARDAVTLEADEEGDFSGWIRRPENRVLLLRVAADEPPFERRLVIRDPPIVDDVLRLDLDLTGVDLEGDVVDEQGQSVRGARIELHRASDTVAKTRSTSTGAFRLSALESGRYRLSGSHDEAGDAAPVDVVIEADAALSPQRLVLVQGEDIEGVIRAHTGQPLAGVGYELLSVGGVPRALPRGQTDLAGRFQARIGANTTYVMVRIFAPGQALWAGCVPVVANQPLNIVLPPGPTGQLVVHLEGDDRQPPLTAGRLVVFAESGGFFDGGDLLHWRTLTATHGPGHDGAGMMVSRLAAGLRYGAAWSFEPWPVLAARACGLAPPPDVDWQFLASGGAGSLAVDVAQLQREAVR